MYLAFPSVCIAPTTGGYSPLSVDRLGHIWGFVGLLKEFEVRDKEMNCALYPPLFLEAGLNSASYPCEPFLRFTIELTRT